MQVEVRQNSLPQPIFAALVRFFRMAFANYTDVNEVASYILKKMNESHTLYFRVEIKRNSESYCNQDIVYSARLVTTRFTMFVYVLPSNMIGPQNKNARYEDESTYKITLCFCIATSVVVLIRFLMKLYNLM